MMVSGRGKRSPSPD